MKDEIAEFKRQNGNENYSIKDLLMYTISRVDKVYDKLEEGTGKIACNRASIRYLTIGVGVIVTVLGFIIKWILEHPC